MNFCDAHKQKGATFKKVFSHSSKFGFFENSTDALNKNAQDESQPLFSNLGSLEKFKNPEGQLHFKLVYPEIPATNEWIQTSNPTTDEIITGFEAIKLDIKTNRNGDAWEGIGFSDQYSLIDDTPDDKYWWTAIGAYQEYPADSETFPGLQHNKVTMVELYVMVPSPSIRKVFYHNSKYGFFTDKRDALKKNAGDETQPLYSILSDLEDFLNSDGKFHFKLVYPEIPATNEWIQSSNPATDTTITGFEAISLDVDLNSYDEAWEGLGYSDHKTLIDDAPDGIRWWTAIGAYHDYPKESGTLPGLKSNTISIVELYVYID